jgi:hypothetical protein
VAGAVVLQASGFGAGAALPEFLRLLGLVGETFEPSGWSNILRHQSCGTVERGRVAVVPDHFLEKITRGSLCFFNKFRDVICFHVNV